MLLSVFAVAALGGLALLQGSLFWRSLDRASSPLEPFRRRPAPVAPALTGRVVLVVLDGLRADRASGMPVLDALRERGAARTLAVTFPTVSIPQYWAMLSGVEPAASGARTNDYRHLTPSVDTLLHVAHDAGLAVAAYSVDTRPWYPPDLAGWFVASRFGEDYEEAVSDGLRAGARLLVVVVDWVDQAGHDGDGGGAAYREAALRSDAVLGRLAARLDLSRDTLLVTADHGHRDQGGHGGDEPECLSVPLVAVGPGVVPGNYGGADLVDIAPTMATLLGLPSPAASQGRPLLDMLALASPVRRAVAEVADRQRRQVEAGLARALAEAEAQDAALCAIRLSALSMAAFLVALTLWRAGAGRRELLAALAYVLGFAACYHAAGGRLSLSSARTTGYFLWLLLAGWLGGGIGWLVVARSGRRDRLQLLWWTTAAVAAFPWFAAMSVVGARTGLRLPSPGWTAFGAWAGIPLIGFVPLLLLELGLSRGPWRGAPPSGSPRIP